MQPKRECGRFRGEPVYRRKHVLACRTAENWIRVGRVVKKDAKPVKWVKQRAVTLQKRRAMQAAVEEGFEPLQQGLYAEYQTEPYVPPPIENVSRTCCSLLIRRVSFRRTRTGTLTCTHRLCFRLALFTFHVSDTSRAEPDQQIKELQKWPRSWAFRSLRQWYVSRRSHNSSDFRPVSSSRSREPFRS